jgi:hypothetical protein
MDFEFVVISEDKSHIILELIRKTAAIDAQYRVVRIRPNHFVENNVISAQEQSFSRSSISFKMDENTSEIARRWSQTFRNFLSKGKTDCGRRDHFNGVRFRASEQKR